MTRTEAVGVAEAAVAIERAGGSSAIVLACDHAANDIPARYRGLGLSPADLEQHFAWDLGALAVSRRLSEMLDAPLVYGRVSRLVIDVNRDPADPDSIVAVGEETPVPGNQNLSPSERRQRVAEVYEPYHAALDNVLRERAARGCVSVLVAVHSFTSALHGVSRPWHCGVLFADDRRVADALVGALRGRPQRGRQRALCAVGPRLPHALSPRRFPRSGDGDDRNSQRSVARGGWAERLGEAPGAGVGDGNRGDGSMIAAAAKALGEA